MSPENSGFERVSASDTFTMNIRAEIFSRFSRSKERLSSMLVVALKSLIYLSKEKCWDFESPEDALSTSYSF